MNDFEEMQRLYEESVPVASRKGRAPSNEYPLKYRPKTGSPTYPAHFMQPGGEGDGVPLPASGEGYSQGLAIPVDEERPAEKQMTNLEVIDKIDVIIKELDPENILDQSVLHALGKLKLNL